jgi:membrane protein DedA with SNARE-associated domain
MLAEIFLVLQSYGYVGAFLINLIASASIILPLPAAAFVFAFGAVSNPLLVGISSGVGATIGEITGSLIGLGGGRLIGKKWKGSLDSTSRLFKRYGGFFIIFAFSVTPLPDDIAGIAAGVLKYPLKKFLVASLAGKVILNVALAYAGFYGLQEILAYF